MTKLDAPTPPDRAADWTCWRDPAHETWKHDLFGWPSCRDCGAGPSYLDRFAQLPEDLAVGVYVPAPDARFGAVLAPRSAIVGLPEIDGVSTKVYYEGWVNGPAQYGDRDARGLWEAGVDHAAGRMVTRYPTIATAVVADTDLVRVGTFWPMPRRIEVTDEDAMAAWLA